MIVDNFHRVHDYLRISLTDNCNLRCFYCMPDERYPVTPQAHLMQRGEIEHLAALFVDLGIKKIRLTGGEPLIRKDAAEIIRAISALPVELTLSTNATRVHLFAESLQQAGIRSINVSLDTLQREKFARITRRDRFVQVRENIDLLLALGFNVKINTVATRGLNDDEIADFIAWTKETPLQVRFIEFMPFSGNHWQGDKVVSLQEILATVSSNHRVIPLQGGDNDTAKAYRVEGYAGSFAVISTMSAPFCATCNRLRLTADGKLKNCLFSTGEVDLLTPLRRGEDVTPLILMGVRQKAEALGGQFFKNYRSLDGAALENRTMIAIGG